MVKKASYQAGDQTMLRKINLSAIMNYVRIDAPISRSTLAKKTGLNKATITRLVGELIARNIVKEVGLESNGIGRPSMNLILNPDAGFMIGVEIGVDFINVLGTDFSPKEIFHVVDKTSVDLSVDEVLELMNKRINQAVEICKREVGGNFLGLAIGVPGLVDYDEGKLLFAPNLKWQNVELKKRLSALYDAPIIIDNEANLAAFGEYFFGSAYQHPDVLYLSAGVGLGGGILHGSELLRGVNGMAGELGHITVLPDGELCGCGNKGCWETLVSLRALYRYIQEQFAIDKTSELWQKTGGNINQLTVEMVITAAQRGDRIAIVALTKVGRYLGIGIASLINSLNPSIVVFGGIMSDAWKFLEPVVLAEIKNRALFWNRENTEIVLAKHGIDACVMGGVATIYQATISQPIAG
ncbi:MAG TPA: ROK family transcriptional regulator [Anaerolineaceae bacterium]|nr:ROK family transcriptional regulator [Anaerolineaceae bacterium]